jgi:hypothetical protein
VYCSLGSFVAFKYERHKDMGNTAGQSEIWYRERLEIIINNNNKIIYSSLHTK